MTTEDVVTSIQYQGSSQATNRQLGLDRLSMPGASGRTLWVRWSVSCSLGSMSTSLHIWFPFFVIDSGNIHKAM